MREQALFSWARVITVFATIGKSNNIQTKIMQARNISLRIITNNITNDNIS